VHLLLTIVAFTGVLIVVNPFKALMHEDTSEMLYMLLPLLSAVLASVGFIYLHDLKGKINQLIMIEYAYICQVTPFILLLGSVLQLLIQLFWRRDARVGKP